MKRVFELHLDGEPIGKGRHRTSLIKSKKTGKLFQHQYPEQKTASYENRLAWAAQIEMRGRPLFEGPLKITITALVSIPASKPKKWQTAAREGKIRPTKKPDWDNIGKIIDALNKIVWLDDCQIADGRVIKFYSDRPSLTIAVDSLSETD